MILNNQNGFSMVQKMISLAISIGASMAVIKLNDVSRKQLKNTASKSSLQLTWNFLTSSLSSTGVCEINFAGKDFPVNFDENKLREIDLEDFTVEDENRKSLIQTNQTLGDNHYKVTKLSLLQHQDNLHLMDLVVDFEKVNDSSVGAKNFSRKVPLKVSMKQDQPNKIESCYSSDDVLRETLERNLCNGPGAIFNTSSGKCTVQGFQAATCSGGVLIGILYNPLTNTYYPQCKSLADLIIEDAILNQ